MTKKLPLNCLKNPVVFIATGFGSGLLPKAPGTYGTVVAVLLYYFLQNIDFKFYIMATLAVSLAGVWISSYAAKKLGVHDHPAIVIDEVAGYWITMIAAPAGWLWVGLGFVFFRFFDIIKPWPISWLDKHIHGGLGIMLDDIVAGFCALASLQLIYYAINNWI